MVFSHPWLLKWNVWVSGALMLDSREIDAPLGARWDPAHWKEQKPAQWSHWLRRTIMEDFLLCQTSEGNCKQCKGNECICSKWKGQPATNFQLWYTRNILTPIFITNYSFPRSSGSWQRDCEVIGWCENGTSYDLQTCHCSTSTFV